MLLVVDANPVISALINKGEVYRVFSENSTLKRFEFISSKFLLDELKNNRDKLLSLTRINKQEFDETFSFIIEQIEFIPDSEFVEFAEEAKALNFKDSPYLALAMHKGCDIFSGDKRLKLQSKVKVFSPRELLGMMGA